MRQKRVLTSDAKSLSPEILSDTNPNGEDDAVVLKKKRKLRMETIKLTRTSGAIITPLRTTEGFKAFHPCACAR